MFKKYIPLIIAAIYILSPFDIIPDWIIGGGWLDDIAMLGLLLWFFSRIKKGADGTYKQYKNAEKPAGDYKEKKEEESNPYTILGVKKNASKDEIKAAYTKLAAKYHPDKVQHLGQEFQDLAHERFTAIKQAYDTLIK